MRGHLKAQVLLAPVLVTGLSARQVNNPYALINLNIHPTSDAAVPQGTTLRLDILESISPCGYGNVTINDQTLAQDEDGTGSGSITTEHGNSLLANWGFTCVHLEDEFQGQVMTFEVISVDNKKVRDVEFTVQFQQMAPVSVSFINATESVVEATISPDDASNEETPATLDDELTELKSMMRRLAALEYAISSKVQYISDVYDIKRPEFHSFAECDSLRCLVKTMYNRAKHLASRLYGQHQGPFGGRHGRPHGDEEHGYGPPWFLPHHGHRPPWFTPHHGNGDRGNHSHCHFPPSPPHRDHPPFHRPPPPEFHEGPPFHGHPPPPPPPSHHVPGDDASPESPLNFDGGKPGRPKPIVESEADFPPLVLISHGRPPDGPPGRMPPHHPLYPAHHPPPFGPPGLFHTISILHIGAIVVLLGLLISAIHTRCFTASRQSRQAGCCGWHRAEGGRCQHRGGTWASRRTAIAAKYCEVVRWLKERVRRQEIEDGEKDAMMRRIGSDSEEEDNLSTTMEQEIAQFRAVASVVDSLVAAEEGRSHEYAREARRHDIPTPPSPTSAFPDYASVDEELPAYDEGSDDSRFVADGFRYTPGSSCYISSESPATESSLDEHLGRKD
ncbi:hypothetical protein F4818DRAFT_155040 [Hypoxylon cercidicola]|nr:hypothetical protein F4818DRAFT_155040 [Hypoxylon cercidicola]